MDLDEYVDKRMKKEGIKEEDFWEGYEEFKIGVFLREARVNNGLTQEELARKIHTTKSVISRMENHSENIKLSTIKKVAKALGKEVRIALV